MGAFGWGLVRCALQGHVRREKGGACAGGDGCSEGVDQTFRICARIARHLSRPHPPSAQRWLGVLGWRAGVRPAGTPVQLHCSAADPSRRTSVHSNAIHRQPTGRRDRAEAETRLSIGEIGGSLLLPLLIVRRRANHSGAVGMLRGRERVWKMSRSARRGGSTSRVSLARPSVLPAASDPPARASFWFGDGADSHESFSRHRRTRRFREEIHGGRTSPLLSLNLPPPEFQSSTVLCLPPISSIIHRPSSARVSHLTHARIAAETGVEKSIGTGQQAFAGQTQP